jgi:hypothetical protein
MLLGRLYQAHASVLTVVSPCHDEAKHRRGSEFVATTGRKKLGEQTHHLYPTLTHQPTNISEGEEGMRVLNPMLWRTSPRGGPSSGPAGCLPVTMILNASELDMWQKCGGWRKVLGTRKVIACRARCTGSARTGACSTTARGS